MEQPPLFSTHVLPHIPAAAELAVLVLRDPAGAKGGPFSAHATAAVNIFTLTQFVSRSGTSALASPGSVPAALVADSVQVALVLQLAVYLSTRPQAQQRKNSPSTVWLQQQGIERGTVEAHLKVLLKNFGAVPPGFDPAAWQLDTAAGALQFALLTRAAATSMPGWQQRYADCIAASATATAPAPAPGKPTGELPRDGRLFAPGMNPAQLQLLLLETAAADSFQQPDAPAASRARGPMLFLSFLDLATNVVQAATPPTQAPAGVSKVLWKVLLVHRFVGQPLNIFIDLLFLANQHMLLLLLLLLLLPALSAGAAGGVAGAGAQDAAAVWQHSRGGARQRRGRGGRSSRGWCSSSRGGVRNSCRGSRGGVRNSSSRGGAGVWAPFPP
jgi:hypothetical protein